MRVELLRGVGRERELQGQAMHRQKPHWQEDVGRGGPAARAGCLDRVLREPRHHDSLGVLGIVWQAAPCSLDELRQC